MSEAMIEARNVVKAFDGFRALDGHRHGQPVQGMKSVKALDHVFYFNHVLSPPLPLRSLPSSAAL